MTSSVRPPNETEGASVAGDARDMLRQKRYVEALALTRRVLENYLSYDDPRRGWVPTRFILGSQYGRLAAAFEDESVHDLMSQVVDRMATVDTGADCDAWRAEVTGYRSDLEAMRSLRAAVVASETGVPIKELKPVVQRAMNRLRWMEKAGTVHIIAGTAYPGPAPTVEPAPIAPGNVPTLHTYFFSSPDDLESTEQKEFYQRFVESVRTGEPLDLEGNLSYAFILLREATARRLDSRKDAAFLKHALLLFQRTAPGTSLAGYARRWHADLAFLVGDFETGLRRFGPAGPDLELYVNLASVAGEGRITPEMVDQWLGQSNRLTDFGQKRKQDVGTHLSDILNELHDELGQSVVMDLWRKLVDRVRLGTANGAGIDFATSLSEGEIAERLAHVDLSGGYRRPREAFAGMPGLGQPIEWPSPWVHTYWFDWFVLEQLQSIYRQAENRLREAEGLHPVGEGWVSEVALLNELRAAFPDERVVHQGRPRWLGQQSLDIYFPERYVAVEYQGLQHSEPVERFGGAEAFVRQQERDQRKRELCRTHGVALIEVHPGYDPEQVIEEIRGLLASRE
ncbi:hypothetical protein [Microbacterium suwonense]|uniref:DUF559 domain-containing protein n=1 Tax=Microbacterium suwonense TaxID=683047 RepID=A0ABN6X5H1_9MICO|nr:hypothetical protein [Microbacterium suwonense]BDZ39936.1 hypothetical protein GCM10025863_25500 [Microbacterium suwonense]